MDSRWIPFAFCAVALTILWTVGVASGKLGFILVPGVLTATFVVALPVVMLMQRHRRDR